MLVAFRVREAFSTLRHSPTAISLSITARRTSSLKVHANSSLWGFARAHKRQYLFGDAAGLERHFHHEHLVHALAVGDARSWRSLSSRDHEALDFVDEGLAQRGA